MKIDRERVIAAMTALAWIGLTVTIAVSYFGHSSSPYGTCYGASGRSIPCEAIAKK